MNFELYSVLRCTRSMLYTEICTVYSQLKYMFYIVIEICTIISVNLISYRNICMPAKVYNRQQHKDNWYCTHDVIYQIYIYYKLLFVRASGLILRRYATSEMLPKLRLVYVMCTLKVIGPYKGLNVPNLACFTGLWSLILSLRKLKGQCIGIWDEPPSDTVWQLFHEVNASVLYSHWTFCI